MSLETIPRSIEKVQRYEALRDVVMVLHNKVAMHDHEPVETNPYEKGTRHHSLYKFIIGEKSAAMPYNQYSLREDLIDDYIADDVRYSKAIIARGYDMFDEDTDYDVEDVRNAYVNYFLDKHTHETYETALKYYEEAEQIIGIKDALDNIAAKISRWSTGSHEEKNIQDKITLIDMRLQGQTLTPEFETKENGKILGLSLDNTTDHSVDILIRDFNQAFTP